MTHITKTVLCSPWLDMCTEGLVYEGGRLWLRTNSKRKVVRTSMRDWHWPEYFRVIALFRHDQAPSGWYGRRHIALYTKEQGTPSLCQVEYFLEQVLLSNPSNLGLAIRQMFFKFCFCFFLPHQVYLHLFIYFSIAVDIQYDISFKCTTQLLDIYVPY